MTKTSPKEYVLIYFRGCPTVETARELLREIGISFTEICQDELPPGDSLREYASPALLENGQPIFGSRLPRGSTGCSIDLPTEYELLSRIFG
jgi:hypothetical protein